VGYEDFGRYLSQQRELRGTSREELARSTKIPPSLLEALEHGQVERLPERIFVLNYLRAYSEALGLAEEETLLRFEEVEREEALEREFERRRTPPKRAPRPALWAALIAALLLGALGGWLVWSSRGGPAVSAPVQP
jgi:cytoskeletal protein RodZ